MKKNTFWFFALLFISVISFSQNNPSIYATMDAEDAVYFKSLYPAEIQILDSKDKQAAVFLTEAIAHRIHDNVQTHGPGYIFRASEEKALQALNHSQSRGALIDFTITEAVLVNECLDMVNGQNIEDNILFLEDFGTRYHTKPQAVQAVMDQKAMWDDMILASGRTDVHTRIYNHVNTPMPSVILTIDGANTPD